MTSVDWTDLLVVTIKVVVIFISVLNLVPFLTWVERRGAALIQDRPGPNRVGPFGLLQPIADFVKFLWKKDPVPPHVNGVLFVCAPFLTLLPACLTLAAIPWGDFIIFGDRKITLQMANLNVGLLYVLAISSLGVYGILFGGWASNNKFSLIGSMRSSSQILSYEIPLGLAAVSAVLIYGTFSLPEMVKFQEGTFLGYLPRWGVFLQPLGFLLFLITSFAETNRLPFDLPETEAELVAGYHTEYGSMKFATYFMAEYISLISISAMMVALFWGGWHLPWISDETLLSFLGSRNLLGAFQVAVFSCKVAAFLCLFIWVRWTVPRFRFDQLMSLAWKNLIPLGLLNIVLTAVALYFWGNSL